MGAAQAWLHEESEPDDDGRVWFMGTFSATADPDGATADDLPSWDAALRWALARAETIYVDFDDHSARYTARGRDRTGDCPPLPKAAEDTLRRGRRRPECDEWLDRNETDTAVEWAFEIRVEADLLGLETLSRARRLGRELAEALRLSGVGEVSWSDAHMAEFVEAMENHPSGGWTWSGDMDLRVSGTACGSTYLPVAQRLASAVTDLLNAENHRMPHRVPDDEHRTAWDARVDVHPPGYQPPFGAAYNGIGTVDVPPDWR